MDVKVFNTKGAEFNEDELMLNELPEIEQHIIDAITEAGGKCGDIPNFRVVSGLDPNITEFIGGKEWRIYAFRHHKHNDFLMYHEQGKEPRVISDAEAKILDKSDKAKGIIIPKVHTHVEEFGIPRYFMEVYRPPEYFGTQEAWDAIRYDKDENDKWFDLMGEYPHEGRYETWFCIEEAIEDAKGNVVETVFKPLDDVAVSFILNMIERIIQKQESLVEQHRQMREESFEDYLGEIKKAKDNVRDIVADRVDRLIETPSTLRRK